MNIKLALSGVVMMAFATEAAATEWNVSVWGKRRSFTEHIEKLSELVSAKTNGEFTMNISYGGLSKNRENLDGISIGAFEMAQFCAGYHRDKNPTITALELPFLGIGSLEEEIAVSMAVYNHPSTIEDLARWNAKLVMPSPMPQYNLVGVGEAPSSLDDFEGMRIRATGGIGQAFSEIGAVPTSVTATEAYNAMQSGVVDSVAFAEHAHIAYRILENGDWWTTNLNPGVVNCPVVVNIDAYDALSDAHREALDSSIDEALQHYLAEYAKIFDRWDAAMTEYGIEPVTFSDEQANAFREMAAGPVRDAWLEKMSSINVPGQELIDLINATLSEVRQ
ncbi:Bacterial extracellular solute-binding protein, family 7 [Pelagimonas phthalicica]|uniref:Bacterial extracellular solute-binding protein, family 7 n=1 Tax=Pelagimonas phthalicica TaxID=1037362 RepID=A0A238JJN5_9RHOB|nr:C4-dicarboxylate TRAP transporter substrate-binding protein [Pelagimonas phthalicica]TDS88728.1 TRAP-type C4-dicarboxylate transport system substrate-binding protein [Pelagimonas phthalicica]SMX30377.1 Bacterial extracellular solute-binding protein, family 7 [Pelagimonas phthalicica]